jgi:hypothetical protein
VSTIIDREKFPLRTGFILAACILWSTAVLAAPLPEITFQLGDVPEHVRDDAITVWERSAQKVQDQIWPFVRSPQPIKAQLMASEDYAAWTEGWLGDWSVGAAGNDWIAIDVQRLKGVGQNLELVLLHEFAHCLISQGAGTRVQVPAWFHEAVAQHVADEWRVRDTASLILDGGVPDLRAMRRGNTTSDVFYRTSLLAAMQLEDRYGEDVFKDIVLAMRSTVTFEDAFARATGETFGAFALQFNDAVRLRYGWLFLVTRWPTLFVLMSLVFLIGAVMKRRRNLAQLEAMPDEFPPPQVGEEWPNSDETTADDTEKDSQFRQ